LITVAPSNGNGGEARSLAPDKNLPYRLSPIKRARSTVRQE
jgi:hypothetical protein